MRCKAELPVAGTLLLRRTGSVRVPKDVVLYAVECLDDPLRVALGRNDPALVLRPAWADEDPLPVVAQSA
jgi:hypothetical protein